MVWVLSVQQGAASTEPKLVTWLLNLQHACRLPDEAVVARSVENPWHQHQSGGTVFRRKPPMDPSSITRWRGRIGEEGVERRLTQTIRAGQKSGVITEDSAKRVAVDATVLEKIIAHPTDARRYERARDQVADLAQKAGVELQQSLCRSQPEGRRGTGGNADRPASRSGRCRPRLQPPRS